MMSSTNIDDIRPLKLDGRYKSSRMEHIQKAVDRIHELSQGVITEVDTHMNAKRLEKQAYWLAHISSDIAAHSRMHPKEYQS